MSDAGRFDDRLTPHARQRLAQRGFRKGDLDLVLLFGERVEDGFLLRDRDVDALVAALERLRGTFVVAPEGEVIVTAYHPSPRRMKKVLASGRRSQERAQRRRERRSG